MRCLLRSGYFNYIKLDKTNIYELKMLGGGCSFEIYENGINIINDSGSYDVNFGEYIIIIDIMDIDEIVVCNEEQFNRIFINKE